MLRFVPFISFTFPPPSPGCGNFLKEPTVLKYSVVCYNERYYNEQYLSIKSGYYNERGRVLTADVACACA